MNRRATRNRMTTRWLPFIALLAAPVLLVAIALRPDTPAVAGQDPPDRTPYGFLDLASGRSLTVKLTSGEPDYGAVTIAVPGVGLFAPTAAAQVTATSANGVQIGYSGDGQFDPNAAIDTELVQYTRGVGPITSVTIQLTATLDTERHTGTAQLTYNGQQYAMTFAEPPRNADGTLQQIVAALNQQDASLLYGLADRRLRGAVSQAQFTTGFNSEFQALGAAMNAQILVAPTYTNERWGYRSATGVISLTADRWSAVAMIYDQGGWKFKSFIPVPVDQVNVTAGGPYTVAPGQSVSVTATPFNPTGGTLAFAWDLDGNGSFETPGQTATFVAAGNVTPGTRTIGVRLTSSTGATATAQTTVTIASGPQFSVSPGGPYDAREDQVFPLTAIVTNPGGESLTFAWDLDGNGTFELDGQTVMYFGPVFDGPSTRTITVRATSAGGATATGQTTLTVANDPPYATLAAPASAPAGGTFTLTLEDVSDAWSDRDSLRFAFDCGDGAGYGAFATATSRNCPAGAAGSRAVGAKARDKDGGVSTHTASVAITAPDRPVAVGAIDAPVAPVRVNTDVAVSATFTAPAGSGPYTATWTWGDGETSVGTITTANGVRSVSGSHRYGSPGVRTIRLTVTGQGGASGAAATEGYVVAYDPARGHATGGGWITSPANACARAALCGGAAGQRAYLGFTAEYRLSGPPLRGGVRFKAGGLTFRSTDVNALTITNARTQLRGRGVINGEGDYEFTLTAVDGKQPGGTGTDRFRIKIWDRATGAVVYDTQPGAADGAAVTTPLDRGSVIVRAQP